MSQFNIDDIMAENGLDGDIISKEALTEILEKLTPAQREVVLMLVSGYSQAEVAMRLNLPNGTVWWHMWKVRERLARN